MHRGSIHSFFENVEKYPTLNLQYFAIEDTVQSLHIVLIQLHYKSIDRKIVLRRGQELLAGTDNHD